jgi:hypothetical protein
MPITLLLAAAQVADALFTFGREPHEFKQFLYARLRFLLRHAPDFERKDDVLEDVLALHEVEVLEDHAHVAAQVLDLLAAESGDLVPHDLHGTLLVAFEPVHAAQQRGLARSRMAHDAEDVAFLHVERDVVQNLRIAVIFAETLYMYQSQNSSLYEFQLTRPPGAKKRPSQRLGLLIPRQRRRQASAKSGEEPSVYMHIIIVFAL